MHIEPRFPYMGFCETRLNKKTQGNRTKMSIDKTGPFKYKTTFFAEKDAKTGHKNTSNMADKHPHTLVKVSHRPGSTPLPHPGLHTAYTRVSSGFKSCF